MIVKAFRGAAGCKKNNKEEITKSVQLLVQTLMKTNCLDENELISIQFSVTKDLTAFNPAAALRLAGFSTVPLFCSQEPHCRGSLKQIVRVLITVSIEDDRLLKPIYILGAEKLRPDIAGGDIHEK